jgi:hypothetical protein
MNILLESVQYKVHRWKIYGDLKVNGMLMGMQGGFTNFCRFLCLWACHSTEEHYIKRDWEPRKTYESGKGGVQHIPLANPMKISLLPFHTELGLIKCLVKATTKTNSKGFQYTSKKISQH